MIDVRPQKAGARRLLAHARMAVAALATFMASSAFAAPGDNVALVRQLGTRVGPVIGAALAGLSGVLYTVWGQYITPSSMGMTAASLPLIWVAVGGRSDLTATIIGTLVVLSGFQALTIYGSQYALVFMGVLLVLTVLIAPNGLVLGLITWVTKRVARRKQETA